MVHSGTTDHRTDGPHWHAKKGSHTAATEHLRDVGGLGSGVPEAETDPRAVAVGGDGRGEVEVGLTRSVDVP